MGVFRRSDSPWWWLWLETAPPGAQREKTEVRVGDTVTQRHDSRRVALDIYTQRMHELAAKIHRLPQARPEIRFAVYATAYQRDVIAHRAGAARETEMLVPLVAFFGADLVTAIDRDRVTQYHTARRTATPPVAARTINREVDVLKGMLRDAVPKYLESSPLVGMRRLRVVPPRRRYVTEAEFDRLLAACDDAQDRAVLLLGRDALIRLGDLLDLQLADRDGIFVTVADPKGGTPYEAPLSPRAQAAWDALDPTERYCFPKFRRAEDPRDWPGSVRQRLERLCARAGLPYGRAARGVTFHWGTRRSGATDLLMRRQKPLAAVQALGNWKQPDVLLEVYTEVTRADLAATVGARAPRRARQKSCR